MSDQQPQESRRRRSTATSAFGVGRREGHDASDFYARFAPPVVSVDDAVADDPAVRSIDRVFHGSSADMAEVADGSVALVVTSPPYFAGKAYETELDADHVPATYLDYLEMLREVFAECARVLEPGGRIAVNVANLGRRPYRSLAADVTSILQDDLRLLLRGEIVWVKQRGASGSCAWGSFQRATNPVLRDLTERVIVASKGRFDRAVSQADRARRGLPSESTMFRDEFMDATLDLWELAPESAKRVGHPAPFPVALPERLINLYTYRGDLVLDPFMGSGTTAVAAVRTDRHFVGYDTDADYVARAEERIGVARAERGDEAPVMPRVPSEPPEGESVLGRAQREGRSAREVVADLLGDAGFTEVSLGAKVAGIDATCSVTDVSGRRLLVNAVGSFSSSGAGLRRPDAVWRELGRAAAIQQLSAADSGSGATSRDPDRRNSRQNGSFDGDGIGVVLVSTDVPGPGSTLGKALTAALATGTLTEVVAMDDRGLDVLAQLAKGLRRGDPGWTVDGPLAATS